MPLGFNDTQGPWKIYYQAAAAADVVVKAKPGILHAILVGKDVGSSVIEVSDHATDGDGNVKIYLEDDTLLTDGGLFVVDAEFETGITVDQTNATNVTYFYK